MPPSATSWASARQNRPVLAAAAHEKRVFRSVLCIFETGIDDGIRKTIRACCESPIRSLVGSGHFGLVLRNGIEGLPLLQEEDGWFNPSKGSLFTFDPLELVITIPNRFQIRCGAVQHPRAINDDFFRTVPWKAGAEFTCKAWPKFNLGYEFENPDAGQECVLGCKGGQAGRMAHLLHLLVGSALTCAQWWPINPHFPLRSTYAANFAVNKPMFAPKIGALYLLALHRFCPDHPRRN